MHRLVLGISIQWRNNGWDGVSNNGRLDCLHKRLFRRRSKKTSKLRVTGLCEWNSPLIGEFPGQRANNAENVSIWWRHHVTFLNKILLCQFNRWNLEANGSDTTSKLNARQQSNRSRTITTGRRFVEYWVKNISMKYRNTKSLIMTKISKIVVAGTIFLATTKALYNHSPTNHTITLKTWTWKRFIRQNTFFVQSTITVSQDYWYVRRPLLWCICTACIRATNEVSRYTMLFHYPVFLFYLH